MHFVIAPFNCLVHIQHRLSHHYDLGCSLIRTQHTLSVTALLIPSPQLLLEIGRQLLLMLLLLLSC